MSMCKNHCVSLINSDSIFNISFGVGYARKL